MTMKSKQTENRISFCSPYTFIFFSLFFLIRSLNKRNFSNSKAIKLIILVLTLQNLTFTVLEIDYYKDNKIWRRKTVYF